MRSLTRLGTTALVLGGLALLACGQSAPEHPLEKARVGQWALYKHTDKTTEPETSGYTYQWVAKVEDRNVTIFRQAVLQGARFGLEAAKETVVNLDKLSPDQGASDSSVTEEEVALEGKTVMCKKFDVFATDAARGRLTITRWISRDVPLYGVVRAVTVDSAKHELSRYELIDFGQTGGSARPLSRSEGMKPGKLDEPEPRSD